MRIITTPNKEQTLLRCLEIMKIFFKINCTVITKIIQATVFAGCDAPIFHCHIATQGEYGLYRWDTERDQDETGNQHEKPTLIATIWSYVEVPEVRSGNQGDL